MGAHRHLAKLLVVVIIMIAAGFASSPAQAHAGHGHGPVAQVANTLPAPAPAVHSRAQAQSSVAARNTESVVIASGDGQPLDLAMTGCNGTCCGTGLSCCTPGVTADDCGLRFPIGSASRIVWPDTLGFSDVYLEALPKPPPSFA